MQKEQQRREKRVSKKAEEVENALKEEEYKLNRLSQTQQALAKLTKPEEAADEGAKEPTAEKEALKFLYIFVQARDLLLDEGCIPWTGSVLPEDM